MNRWFAYIVFLLISLPFLLAARSDDGGVHISARSGNVIDSLYIGVADTTNKAKPPPDDKKNKINVKKKEPEREASNSGQAKTLLVRLKTPRPLSLSRLLSAL